MSEKTYDYLKTFEHLINKFEALNVTTNIKEPNLFNVGARGHFENPTTELLAFFLNPANHHGLEDCFFNGLQSAISKKDMLSSGYVRSVETEVTTENNKRIDLLIETDTTLIVIECKIYSDLYNPLDDYTNYCKERIRIKHEAMGLDSMPLSLIRLVLCPEGRVSEEVKSKEWYGISYNDLVHGIEQELSNALLDNPYNKWGLFAREFLLHLKELNTMTEVKKEEIEFFNDNFGKYSEFSKYIYEDLMPRIGTSISNDLNNSQLENFDCKVKSGKWYYYEPVIKFSNLNWGTGSDIVLWMKADEADTSHRIHLHIANQTKELTNKFADLVDKSWQISEADTWTELNDTYWGISWKFRSFDLEKVSAEIVELMGYLNELELNYRPKLV